MSKTDDFNSAKRFLDTVQNGKNVSFDIVFSGHAMVDGVGYRDYKLFKRVEKIIQNNLPMMFIDALDSMREDALNEQKELLSEQREQSKKIESVMGDLNHNEKKVVKLGK